MALVTRRKPYAAFSNYRHYKSRLREDFSYCCVYCTVHENEWGGPRHFHVEHFRPKSTFPDLETDYDNLMYACDVCNCYKGDDWPSDDPTADGKGYLDPCQCDFQEHFEEEPSTGQVRGLTLPAVYMVESLHLNRKHLVRLRIIRLQEEKIHLRYQQLCSETLEAIEHSLSLEDLPYEVHGVLETAAELIREMHNDQLSAWNARARPQYAMDDFD